jgi:16S rRNA processing protein RimM
VGGWRASSLRLNAVDGAETIEVVIGRIGKPHGLRGEVTVEPRTDEPDRRFATGTTVRAERPSGSPAPWPELTVLDARWHRTTLLVRFEELVDRTTAEAARGLLLHATVPADERPDDPDEFYDHQLLGLAVVTGDGAPLGEIADLLHLPGQDVLAVKRPDGPEVLIPFIKQFVPVVDVKGGRVVVTPPEGLLDLASVE